MIWLVLGALVALFVIQFVHLSLALAWGDRKVEGLAYYGAPPAARERFRRALGWHRVLLTPILAVLSRTSTFRFSQSSFRHSGLTGPRGVCSPESFARGIAYRPGREDVLVATQMKCGTTWMLHLVYQLLRRGKGDLVETGSTLHAVCPWLEGRRTVPLEEAPLVGDGPRYKVIKTHLPASHCPITPDAKYIYVARHPVSCFASCADFVVENAGPFAPPLDLIEDWFRSDTDMWWGSWPAHVQGWWDLSRQRNNVLFVLFEDMKKDLGAVARKVESLLGIAPLSEAEMGDVLRKCSFAYMQEHDRTFEMHPPHLLAAEASLFVRGSADRHLDVPEGPRRRIREWCAERLEASSFPIARFYPDVTAGKDAASTAPSPRPA